MLYCQVHSVSQFTPMQQTLETLFKMTPDLAPKLKSAAKVILDNPNLVATNSMRALAKKSGVTPPTMIRLANTLGFENYDSFKKVFQNWMSFGVSRGFISLNSRLHSRLNFRSQNLSLTSDFTEIGSFGRTFFRPRFLGTKSPLREGPPFK